jgi:hypothetical protein
MQVLHPTKNTHHPMQPASQHSNIRQNTRNINNSSVAYGQWWSIFTMQRPQILQWCARWGL